MIEAIAAFLGRLFREILPAIFDEWRKPREHKHLGGASDEVEQDIIDDLLGGGDVGLRSEDSEPVEGTGRTDADHQG
jgi:hypothetical protein